MKATAKDILKLIKCGKHNIETDFSLDEKTGIYQNILNIRCERLEKKMLSEIKITFYLKYLSYVHFEYDGVIWYLPIEEQFKIIKYCYKLMKYHLDNTIDFSDLSPINEPKRYFFKINIYL